VGGFLKSCQGIIQDTGLLFRLEGRIGFALIGHVGVVGHVGCWWIGVLVHGLVPASLGLCLA